jgi:cytochrome P450
LGVFLVIRFSPYDYDFHEDPYPIYKQLRDHAPLYRNDEIGFWAVSRYDDVLAAFKDTERFSSAKGVSLERSSSGDASAVASFLAMDPPRHDHMRALVSKGFTPRRVADLEPNIRALATHYIDQFIEAGSCELISQFAGRLPMDVVSELLGIPSADREMLRGWSDSVMHREPGKMEVPPAGMEASMRLLGYFAQLVQERRRQPSADLASALLAAELDGKRLEDREVVSFLFLMVIAGNETTTKLIGNALYWLWRNPSERDKLRADPTLIPAWIEETLRYDNSSQMLARTVSGDVTLHGRTMHDGDKLLILVGSANRDERVWERPAVYDIGRDTTAHLSFGKGTHFCLGASLARLEARVALEELWRRLGAYQIDEPGLVRVHNPNVRGFAVMPIEFGGR